MTGSLGALYSTKKYSMCHTPTQLCISITITSLLSQMAVWGVEEAWDTIAKHPLFLSAAPHTCILCSLSLPPEVASASQLPLICSFSCTIAMFSNITAAHSLKDLPDEGSSLAASEAALSRIANHHARIDLSWKLGGLQHFIERLRGERWKADFASN